MISSDGYQEERVKDMYIADTMQMGLITFCVCLHALLFTEMWGLPWYSGSAMDCWSTGRSIDSAPGAWFLTNLKVIILARCPRPSLSLQCGIVA